MLLLNLVFNHLRLLYRMKSSLSIKIIERLIHAFTTKCLDDCNVLSVALNKAPKMLQLIF